MNKYDYRLTDNEGPIEKILDKKALLKASILSDHPRQKNFYTIIRNKSKPYKGKFMQIFNGHCAYCGNSIDNISIDLFEIDHYVNKTSFEYKILAGQIENLVPTCQTCNRGKSDFVFMPDTIDLLNPNLGFLEIVFTRNTEYCIVINDAFKDNISIEHFHKDLKLGSEVRRLDYLLMQMRDLAKNKTVYGIDRLIRCLSEKRHSFTIK